MPDMSHPTLSLESLAADLPIAHPATTLSQLTVDSPASALLTDFTRVRARTIGTETPAEEARLIMQASGVRLLLVADADGHCQGIVTAKELLGGRRTTQAMQTHQIARTDVTVGMVQSSCSMLHALPLTRLAHLTIGDLVKALQAHCDQHLLIVDQDEQLKPRLRGLVSASDAGRALGIELGQLLREPHSFADICRVMLGHEL
ncbi:CBS domain-containing protein [Halomonas sp. YLGW01]|uniref:CBS domain-containing protein n=1 Tax=Halomonas sp. YLGW01 TaxID=2773308 RepID=UPI0017869722|nr:CBS domain-containing protein [Halomonas sp. YLGW01]